LAASGRKTQLTNFVKELPDNGKCAKIDRSIRMVKWTGEYNIYNDFKWIDFTRKYFYCGTAFALCIRQNKSSISKGGENQISK
jgi:hypothetical protein